MYLLLHYECFSQCFKGECKIFRGFIAADSDREWVKGLVLIAVTNEHYKVLLLYYFVWEGEHPFDLGHDRTLQIFKQTDCRQNNFPSPVPQI